MKPGARKLALSEISQSELNKSLHESIKQDRASAKELRQQLGAPEGKKARTRYFEIQAELGKIKENEFAYKHRRKLYEEMNEIQPQITALQKSLAILWAKFRNENKEYNAQMRDDRALDMGRKPVAKITNKNGRMNQPRQV